MSIILIMQSIYLNSQSKTPKKRYRGTNLWTFPRANHIPDQEMRDTLLDLCENQLAFRPHLVGRSPFAVDKFASKRQVFYYRAHATPDLGNVMLENAASGLLEDFAWVEGGNLGQYLSPRLLRTCRPGMWL